MKKKYLAVTIVIAIVLALTSCGTKAADEIKHTIAQMIQGNISGEIGKTYATQWFEFTVESIKSVDSYAGYTPNEGYALVDVLITEKGTFDDDRPTPMGTFDFYMDSDTFSDYLFPLDPIDSTMMPEEFDLEYGEVVTYHMVYEVPEDVSDLKLMYTEIDEADEEGATFSINVVL